MGQRNRRTNLPIDSGWAWVICFASFLSMFIIGSATQTLSVLFLELVIEFQSSVTITSLTVLCFVMSVSVSSVVSTSVLVPTFGERPVVIVAGALFSLCSIGYSLSPSIIVFIVFAAVKGSCVGLIFVPSFSLLSYYFNRRRSLATTIGNGGVCVASIVSPPIIRAITEEYGMRGTFLILASLELHMIVAGLLMRPVSSYRPAAREDTGMTELDENEDVFMKEKSVDDTQTVKNGPDSGLTQSLLSISLTYDPENTEHPNEGDKYTKSNNGRFYDGADNHVSDVLLEDSKDHELSKIGIEFSNEQHVPSQNYTKEPTSLQNISKSPVKMEILKKDPVVHHNSSHRDSVGNNSYHGSNWSINQKPPGDALFSGSVMSITSGLEPAFTGVVLHDQHEEEDHGWKSCCFFRIVRRIFDPILLRQLSFRMYLVSAVPSATTQYLIQYIPTIAVIKGATNDQAATLLTITGSVDLVSRLAVGFFADTNILRPTQIVAISQICQGIFLQLNSLFNTFEKMIAMVVIMGLFIGTRQSLIPMMHIEIVGVELMGRCLSITAMVATISSATHSPLLSAILEATGSYEVVLHYVGIALIVGAVIILFMPLLERIDKKRGIQK